VFFDLIPIGTKVTVVNQPYLFGWRDGTLYMQAYEVMEDDARNWTKERQKLLTKIVQPKMRESMAGKNVEIDWQRVHDLAHAPRAIPMAVSGPGEELDVVLARSLLVENTLPEGSNWDGKSGLLVDEKTFNDLVSTRDKTPPITSASPGPSSAAVR
jgi:L,D-transpeptidase ErfK/SrfK